MFDAMPAPAEETYEFPSITSLNETLNKVRNDTPPQLLFDTFWREGNLALLFGATGTGKSTLALQMADAIARGRPIGGLRMSKTGRKVLVLTGLMSDAQMRARYAVLNGELRIARTYQFSSRLYHAQLPPARKLAAFLRGAITKHGIKVIIIDDLAMLRTAADGVRELILVMRELRKLKEELDVSILAMLGSRAPRRGHGAAENDLQRGRILCDLADSVIALGRDDRGLQMFQTRSRSGPIDWTPQNGPRFEFRRTEEGMLRLEFDSRFDPEMDEETRSLVCSVRKMRDAGTSLREIAEKLSISKSRVERLYKKWRPGIEPGLYDEGDGDGDENEDDGPCIEGCDDECDDECGCYCHDEDDDYYPGKYAGHYSYLYQKREPADPGGTDAASLSDGAILEGSPSDDLAEPETQDDVFWACGCRPGSNSFGKFIWVEKTKEDGTPLVTYEPNGKRFNRWRHGNFGRDGMGLVNGPICPTRWSGLPQGP